MRLLFSAIFILLFLQSKAQVPPRIQWQKCIGGSQLDGPESLKSTTDGGYIVAGFTTSNDGDVSGYKDSSDAWVVKFDGTGAIQWQHCYGGAGNDGVSDIIQTADGGYIFTAQTTSVDGDVTGNHGNKDIWVVKISSVGVLQWQKCYGSSANDGSVTDRICEAATGGYIVSSQVMGGDGDVIGYHPASANNESQDLWVFKIDLSGNLLWQNCFGGTRTDGPGTLIPVTSGNYIITGNTRSIDGNMCSSGNSRQLWMAKINEAGTVLWQQCLITDANVSDGKETSDGGFVFAGGMNVPGKVSDFYVIKTDASGMKQWEKNYGGTQYDLATGIVITADGGYAVVGHTSTAGEIICNFKGGYDIWLMKLDPAGTIIWQKSYGGSKADAGNGGIVQTPDAGFLVAGYVQSNDGDVSGLRGFNDIWLVKFVFPGIEILPTINITASETAICPGKKVIFSSTIIDGGDSPFYQWQVNGTTVGTNSNTYTSNTLNDGDIVTCMLTSNSPCVTTPTVVSNSIVIRFDLSQVPANFLPADTASICQYGLIEMKPAGSFKSYLWSTGATSPGINITQPGKYILKVTTNEDCTGIDSIIVSQRDCFIGFYMPTAFSPNEDGKNELLKPFIGGRLIQYRFIVMNRSGQVVFKTTEPGKGWDGKLNGIRQNSDVYVWTCSYQFAGEEAMLRKGTVTLIR